MSFNPMAFVENLKYMGLGMLGIFAVMAVIIAVVYLLGSFAKNKDKKDKE
ncbi:MAG: hypothetical protein ACI3XQ_04145 [Eubacteriales bacterium]